MDAIGVLVVGAGLYLGWCAYKGYSPWSPGTDSNGHTTGILGILGAGNATTTAVAPAGSGGY